MHPAGIYLMVCKSINLDRNKIIDNEIKSFNYIPWIKFIIFYASKKFQP